ncbi:MAG TPA: M15 family metallopeptidase [Mycobacteriales bacterium]|nr:M15 family metallopeptidase [Mycobacteriales bacterium]
MKRTTAPLVAVLLAALVLVVPPASATGPAFTASVRPVTAQDLGSSWRSGCPVGPAQLRMLTLSHWGFDGVVRTGRMVVHVDQVPAVLGVFGRLFDVGFPIERMVTVDVYGGDDDASMAANNTSAFNCRTVAGTSSWSLHAYGRALDLNPVQNPYVRGSTVQPPAGRAYLDRSSPRPGMVRAGDAVVTAFAAAGWSWGGAWSSSKDYQHFEGDEPSVVRSAPSLVSPSATSTVQARRGAGDRLEVRVSGATSWGPWRDAGGQIVGDPALASEAPGRLDVVALGADGGLWHRASDTAGASWYAWTPLGGRLTSSPSAVAWGPGRLDVVARGADGAVWQRSWTGSAWTGWQSLGGQVRARPELASWAPGRLDLVARGADGAIWHRSHSGSWGGWRSLGGTVVSDPAAVSWGPGRLDVVARGADGALWQRSWNGAGWLGWGRLGGTSIAAPELTSPAPDRLDAYVTGSDGGLWRLSWNGDRWSGWTRVAA